MRFNLEIINKKLLKNKELLVITPTRDRIEKVKEHLESFKKTSSDKTCMLLAIDKDDPKFSEYLKLFGEEWSYIVIEKRKTCIQIYNYIVNYLCKDFKYYMPSNDDFVFLTNLWDTKLIEKIKEKGGWAIAYGDDRIHGEEMPTTSVISGNIVRALGYLQLPSLTHLFGDNAVKVIGQGLGRLFYVPQVVIQHKHFIDKKTPHDNISLRTNSPQMYEEDQKAIKLWFKHHAKAEISKVVAAIHKESGFNKTISLCMIIADSENPKVLRRCLESVKSIVSEVNIVFNYKHIKRPWRVKTLMKTISSVFKPDTVKSKHLKWTNFSEIRNVSLKMATCDYCLYLDCDDMVDAEWMLLDAIFLNPDIDAFRCTVISYHSHKGAERVLQFRLFKNGKGYYFQNNVHEDISLSMKELDARLAFTDIQIHHFGNLSKGAIKKKNLRNYKLTLQEINSPRAHSLTYFAIVNELLLFGEPKKLLEAIHWIDKYMEKFPDTGIDPLVPKMWTLRGVCALDCNQLDAARTNFAKAWNGWKHPEAGIMLAECHIRKQEWDKAIDLLEEMNKVEKFEVCNIPIDMETIELSIIYKLGFAYDRKAESIFVLKKEAPQMYTEDAHKMFQQCIDNAEKYYEKYLSLVPKNEFIGDRLISIYRDKGKMSEANFLTVSMVNMFPRYAVGWKNLAMFELMNKRYITASVFFREALSINPKDKESKHNLNMIRRMK